MPSISSFLQRNTLKRDVFAWDRFNLIKLHELMADPKMKDGAVLYVNTTRPPLGQAKSFVSTREKTTSHGLFTPRGSKDQAATRLRETLDHKFADGRHYGTEAYEARAYIVDALATKMEVVKDPDFLKALRTVAYAKEVLPAVQTQFPQQASAVQHPVPAGGGVGYFANLLAHLVPGMTPTTPMDEAIRLINEQPDASKQAIKDVLLFRARHHRTDADPYMANTALRLFVALDAPAPADPAPSVGNTSETLGSFAQRLQEAARDQLHYAEFAEIDETTTLGELLDNINSRSPEMKKAIKDILSAIIGLVPGKGPKEWPQLFGHAHMAARVAAGIEANAPADPYADIDGADLFDYPNGIRPMPPAIHSVQASSEDYFGLLNLSR